MFCLYDLTWLTAAFHFRCVSGVIVPSFSNPLSPRWALIDVLLVLQRPCLSFILYCFQLGFSLFHSLAFDPLKTVIVLLVALPYL